MSERVKSLVEQMVEQVVKQARPLLERALGQVLAELRNQTLIQERIVANQEALLEAMATEDDQDADQDVALAAYLDGTPRL